MAFGLHQETNEVEIPPSQMLEINTLNRFWVLDPFGPLSEPRPYRYHVQNWTKWTHLRVTKQNLIEK